MNPYDNAEALLRMLSAPRRNNFFYGKRMDVQHFQMEQDYGKTKRWLLNRLTLGKGVLCGLKVTIDGALLCVDPGFAIDGLGREIVVPVRACIDPLTNDGGCCAPCCAEATTPPPPAPAPVPAPVGLAPPAVPDLGGNVADPSLGTDTQGLGLFTLWLCYKECKTDFEPVLVSECGSRQPCAAGTIVESFCLKVTPGAAPLQQDPAWCAQLWPAKDGAATAAPRPGGVAVGPVQVAAPPSPAAWAGLPSAGSAVTPSEPEFRASLDSHRRILCELLSGGCAVAEDDSCVPLGLFVMRDKRLVFFDDCLVRPRVYSNATLLDLILCLAEKIDDCCNGHPPPPPPAPPMRVASIDFVRRVQGKPEEAVTTVATPLQITPVDIGKNANAIRVRFTQAFAQDTHKPVTHGPGDADFDLRNVRILPVEPLGGIPFVPGTLTIEAADTIRFDLFEQQPYALPSGGWQKGRFRILLRGTDAANAPALANMSDIDLDGEAIAPAGGAISGDGTAGGDFEAVFVVGGGAPPPPPPVPTLRVQSVQFVNASAQLTVSLDNPLKAPILPDGLASIRIKFTTALATDAAHAPSVADQNDPDFTTHNVQVALVNGQASINYVPGTVTMEAEDTLRFDVRRGTRVVNADGAWIRDISDCRMLLRGTPPPAGAQAPLCDTSNRPLDGEPIAPAGGVISGDGTAGGDFLFEFSVKK